MTDIVERLRYTANIRAIHRSDDDPIKRDCIEAAAEIERMRAALHNVVHGWEVPQDGNWNRVFRSVWGKARAALDGQPAPGKEEV